MKRMFFVVGALLFLTSVTAHGAGSTPDLKTAKAEIINSQGTKIGIALLEDVPGGVKISLKVSNLSPGMHAFHIHAVGKAEPPDFKSSGPHFNPEGKKHGHMNPAGAHAGDLSNIEVKANGTAEVEIVVKGVTLSLGKDSLLGPGGTSLVIHAKADDEMTDPAGNAGNRIAAGVIVVAATR